MVIVEGVAELRLMSGRQLKRLFFPVDEHATGEAAARQARRVLARLVELRLLVRLQRRVGGVRAGSASFVYGLGPVGARLLDEGLPRARRYEPSAAFVDHALAVSELVVEVIETERRGGPQMLHLEAEPACWRSVPSEGRAVLRPDLLVVLASGEFEDRWFIEVDRGTHHAPALLRKARLYQRYYQSGVEQAEHGVFPRVLWVVPDKRRVARLRELFAAERFASGLMVVSTTGQAVDVLSGSAP